MKSRRHLIPILIVIGFAISAGHTAFAQEPSPPAKEPVATESASGGVVYLKQEYVDSLKTTGLLDSNKMEGVFRRFDGDFALFRRKGSREIIYIPKSAILYMTGKETIY